MIAARRLGIAALAAVLGACARAPRPGAQREERGAVAARSIDEVLATHADSLLRLPGVVGTAIARCGSERCIKVLVADAGAETKARIPATLEGYRVVVEVTGTVRPR